MEGFEEPSAVGAGAHLFAQIRERVGRGCRSRSGDPGGGELLVAGPLVEHHADVRGAVEAGDASGLDAVESDEEAPVLFAEADASLYEAKRAGRGRACVDRVEGVLVFSSGPPEP